MPEPNSSAFVIKVCGCVGLSLLCALHGYFLRVEMCSLCPWSVASGVSNAVQEEDVQYEEDIMRNAFNVKAWLRYLEHKKKAKPLARFVIYERAVKELPGRYTCVLQAWETVFSSLLQTRRAKLTRAAATRYGFAT